MPPKKGGKNVKLVHPQDGKDSRTSTSESSVEVKPKKQKPLTKKEIERMRKIEKEMKEELERMKREADAMLAEFKEMEEAAQAKTRLEEEQQGVRVERLTKTCETFETAKLRLTHENNKVREEEIWNRYITTDQKPYPECTPNMHDHLYLWRQHKVTDDITFVLNKSDTYVETLDLLEELIEYPLYTPKKTVANWKELRTEWRREYLERIDKSCFHMIKNLSRNFKQQPDQKHVYAFDFQSDHITLGMSAWTENHDIKPSYKWTPQIIFKRLGAEIIMPRDFREKPFILRLIYLDRDFFSEDSLTSDGPPSIAAMETNMLKEIQRCFEAMKESKLLVADREREKVRLAKQKILEAQEAANQAELSFKALQEQTKDLIMKTQGRETPSKSLIDEQQLSERRLKPKGSQAAGETLMMEPSFSSLASRRRGAAATTEEPGSTAKKLMQNPGAMKTLDAISMKSGMRKKHDKMRQTIRRESDEERDPTNVFKTRSMIDVPEVQIRTQIRKDSTLCFEDVDDDSLESTKIQKISSFDSLDMLLGTYDEEGTIPTLRQLIKRTEIVERDLKVPKSGKTPKSASISWDGKRKKNRAKSIASVDKKSTLEEEIAPTASDIFEAKEDARQDQYLNSLYGPTKVKLMGHVNLRMYSIVSGTYILDLISHVPQPHTLPNGTTVQIFYGEMNITREDYEYEYIPPPPPAPDENPTETLPDAGLLHLLHVKVPLPENVAFFEPPGVALWDRERKHWTTEYVKKLEIDVGKSIATFSLSRILPFAFCVKKFVLLPYLSWALKPRYDIGAVSLTVKSFLATLEFHVTDFATSLVSAVTREGKDIPQLEDIITREMHLHKLIAAMKSRGVNVFPDEDTCIYTENAAKAEPDDFAMVPSWQSLKKCKTEGSVSEVKRDTTAVVLIRSWVKVNSRKTFYGIFKFKGPWKNFDIPNFEIVRGVREKFEIREKSLQRKLVELLWMYKLPSALYVVATLDTVLEDHTNLSIAMWSDYLEFQGCEWNGDFKRRKLAFRVRECLSYNLELRYRTIVASSLSAMIYRLGLEDTSFDESKVENYGFSPDVSNLLEKAFIHVDASMKLNPLQVLNVYALLSRTKVLSFCGANRKETASSSSDDSKKSTRKKPRRPAKSRNKHEKVSTDGNQSEISLLSNQLNN